MQSKSSTEVLDTLEQDLAITSEDAKQLWRNKMAMQMSTPEYLAWCTFLSNDPRPAHHDLTSDKDVPFVLE
jgi:hypothetical protein